MTFKFFAPIFMAIALVDATGAVRLAFSARSLPPRDIGYGAPDAFVKVYYAPSASGQFQLVGVTENISDNTNPDWPETFEVVNDGGDSQRLKIDMYDSDSPDPDDYMGFVELTLMEIIYDGDGLVTKNLTGATPSGGQLLIKRQ